MIPLFLAEDEENSSSMRRQRVFTDLNDPLDCYDDLELVQRFRFSSSSISKITDLIDVHFNFTQRSRPALPHYKFLWYFNFVLQERSRSFVEMELTLTSLPLLRICVMLPIDYRMYITSL